MDPQPDRPEKPEYSRQPKEGTPEFLAMIEQQKDEIEGVTGVRPDLLLDVGPSDDPQRLRRGRS